MRPRGLGVLLTGQHAGQLAHPGVPVTKRTSDPVTIVSAPAWRRRRRALGDHEVGVGERRDLGQVGHDDHLGACGRAAASRRPTSTAARPPTPASTSSNTNVRAGFGVRAAAAPPTSPGRPRSRASRGTAHRRTRPCRAAARAHPACGTSRISPGPRPTGPARRRLHRDHELGRRPSRARAARRSTARRGWDAPRSARRSGSASRPSSPSSSVTRSRDGARAVAAAVQVEQAPAGVARPGSTSSIVVAVGAGQGVSSRACGCAPSPAAAGPPAGRRGSAASSVATSDSRYPTSANRVASTAERRVGVRCVRPAAAPRALHRAIAFSRAPSASSPATRRVRPGRRRAQVLRVGQPLDPRPAARRPPPARVHPLDLGQAEPQQLDLARPVGAARRPGPSISARRPPRSAPRRAVGASTPLVRGPTNASSASRCWAGERSRSLVRLAVHRDQVVGDLREHALRHGAAAEEGARPARRPDGPQDDQRCRRRPARRPPRRPGSARRAGRRRARRPSTAGRRRAGAHRRRVGLAAQQQVEAGEHHRLAGAGLPRDDGQPADRGPRAPAG